MSTITLDSPIARGDQTIAELELRKPTAGELRGVSLADLLRMEVGAISTVLPRIATPTLTAADVARMDPADLLQCGTEVVNFLLPKSLKAEATDSQTA